MAGQGANLSLAASVRPEHKFDEVSLDKYLLRHLYGYPYDANGNLFVRQYRYVYLTLGFC